MAMTQAEKAARCRATRSPERIKAELAYKRAWRAANPDRVLGQNLKKYGLTVEAYRALLTAQRDQCAICGGSIFEQGSGVERELQACVDHCHATGKVRGLLCPRCNQGLGLFKDNKESLMQAINYLEGPHDG